MSRQTLVVNIFGGPGSGKSTTATGVFYELKSRHIECEFANEVAKEFVWEHREFTFNDQIYLFAKQYHRIFCLLGQVDIIVTDCPILLTPVYDTERRESLTSLVLNEHNKMWSYNILLNRVKQYNPHGRLKGHDEKKVINLDSEIKSVLDMHSIPYDIYDGNNKGKKLITETVLGIWRKWLDSNTILK
jgi:deoxyadenosine/deoxycytidine kinase